MEFLRGESLTLQSVGQNASESMAEESMDVIRIALDALVEAILGFHEDGSVKGTCEWLILKPMTSYYSVCSRHFLDSRVCEYVYGEDFMIMKWLHV